LLSSRNIRSIGFFLVEREPCVSARTASFDLQQAIIGRPHH
jgi:hypothetical protein